MTSPQGVNSISANGLPRGELLGRYTSYLDAQKLVDYLADNDFPVASVTIVGNDVRTVERVTAKLSYPKVALAGAAQGAMMGLFVGLLMSLFTGGNNGVYQILSAVGLGMAIWMIAGVISYSTRRGKRDFASSSQFVATSFDVVVDFEHAQAARTLASQLPMRPQQPMPSAPVQQPMAQQAPAQPAAPAQGTAAPAQPEAKKDGPNGQFPDLPDGRPRYGVRVETTPAEAPEAKPAQPAQPAQEGAAQDNQARPAPNLAQEEPTVSQPASAPSAPADAPEQAETKDEQGNKDA
ncbi:general stress protein [Glutamicibacter sp.]|uniref:general stress protein n=1 Tax=Glutamicibacter sp. TaxID=1931995 RepID=UPI0028BD3F72|nr:general stress protein [Glutamicibacter sp.]